MLHVNVDFWVLFIQDNAVKEKTMLLSFIYAYIQCELENSRNISSPFRKHSYGLSTAMDLHYRLFRFNYSWWLFSEKLYTLALFFCILLLLCREFISVKVHGMHSPATPVQPAARASCLVALWESLKRGEFKELFHLIFSLPPYPEK